MARLRFGLFDFDPATGELRREGISVRLQGQPAQVLALLIANPGELVTREALQQAVWSDGTNVDFERGLNFCIAQIRSALGDSADSPRFVRTVPKKGYQFIAPLETNGKPGVLPEPEIQTVKAPAKRPWAIPVFAALLLGVCAATWIGWTRSNEKVIAICLFDNETGEAAVDQLANGFTDAMTAEMTNAGAAAHLQVIGNAAILRKPRGERNFIDIAKTLRADYVIFGQIYHDKDHYRILAHLLRLPQQTHLSVERLEIETLDRPLEAEDAFARKAAARFLRKLASLPNSPSR